ncbi:MAG: hypothetical protein ABW212_09035 [Pseudonocardia sediminis]
MSDLLLFAQTDPTGLSSPLGRIVIFVALLASLAGLVRLWMQYRKR